MIIKKIEENLIEKSVFEDICKSFNLNKKVAEILVNRGIDTKEKVDEFLNANINNLKDPFLLKNMEKVVARIEKAIENNEKILIFGDYDVDGICASSIMFNYLKTKTENAKIYLPNRFEDGYGLSCPVISKIAEKLKPNLIITVDCGISCHDEVEFVKNLGIDIIVTDHHELPKILPECVVVNTKFEQEFGFNGLCGAGVAFKIVQALCFKNGENFEKYLPICALATIADIVPLQNENRIIVKEGLKRLHLLPVGVQILLKNTFGSVKNITATNIAFKIAPKINSAGRLDDAKIALELFVSSDLKTINQSLKKLENLNDYRKNLCDKIFEEAKFLAKKCENLGKIIILKNKNWDVGVLGIVCAKICEEFGLPCILFGEFDGELRGSCRTVGNINAVKIFENSQELLLHFGGHQKAGGVSLLPENFDEFVKKSQIFVNENYDKTDFVVEKIYDTELTNEELNVDFVKSLEVFEPCGYENNKPIFKINLGAVKVSKMPSAVQHLLINSRKNVDFLAFNDEKNFENYLNFNEKTILTELEINSFRNRESVKGIVKYSGFNKPNNALCCKLYANFFESLNYDCDFDDNYSPKQFTSLKQIERLCGEKTAFITYDAKRNFESENCLTDCVKTSFCVNGLNKKTLIFGTKNVDELKNYDIIVFLERPLDENFVKFVHKKTRATIFVPTKSDFKPEIKVSREEFLNVYFGLVKAINKNLCAYSTFDYFELMQTNFDIKFDFVTFSVGVMIFKELKIVEEKSVFGGKICFKLNKIKADLFDSKIFRKLVKIGEKND